MAAASHLRANRIKALSLPFTCHYKRAKQRGPVPSFCAARAQFNATQIDQQQSLITEPTERSVAFCHALCVSASRRLFSSVTGRRLRACAGPARQALTAN